MNAPTGAPRGFSQRLGDKLACARRVVAFTGAGISAESGVPTFRGDEGIWTKFKPGELARFDAFMKNPDLVWAWYQHRREIIIHVQPNAGHLALAAMERHFPHMAVITQNIDNLHRRAGSNTIYELHGNIERNYCIGCGRLYGEQALAGMEEGKAPRCPACSGLIRPDVVWFGEILPVDEWNASVAAAERADIFFAIGTSAVVYPAASLPAIARRAGAYVVEINIEPTDLSRSADEVIAGAAGEILPRLLSFTLSLAR